MPDPPQDALPRRILRPDAPPAAGGPGVRKAYLPVLLSPVFPFTGVVLALQFQPPGVQNVYPLTGQTPGGGTSAPIALPPDIALPRDLAEILRPTDLVGLARLLPRRDARVVEIW